MLEKVPLMTRFDRLLEKHGLSFGDALNIVLFLLTIASLYLAYQGVRLARVTLEDARAQATQAQKDAAKAAQDEDIQFQKQMAQLKTASDAMRQTTTLMTKQGKILRDLQGISRQQLKDLNAAEARFQTLAKPHIIGSCMGTVFMDADLKPAVQGGMPLQIAIIKMPAPKAKAPADHERTVACSFYLSNKGDAELRNANLSMELATSKFGDSCSSSLVSASLNRSPLALGETKTVMDRINIPARSEFKRDFPSSLVIQLSGKCKEFTLFMTLESDNFDQVVLGVYAIVAD